jgi:hypothetical protein
MEIIDEGLTLGAGTMLAGVALDGRGAPKVALDDEPRAMSLLATAYERPVTPHVVASLRRACERWNEGEKALAHIHLAYASLPPCDADHALRLFVADELIEAGVTPEALMKAQGFDPAPLKLLKAKFNPAQPRVPAGRGRESGESSGGDATITLAAFRPGRGRHEPRGRGGWLGLRAVEVACPCRRHGPRASGGWLDAIRVFLESLCEWRHRRKMGTNSGCSGFAGGH